MYFFQIRYCHPIELNVGGVKTLIQKEVNLKEPNKLDFRTKPVKLL